MKTSLHIVILLFATVLSQAQESRYETATGTNAIAIADYESGELISVLSTNNSLSYSPLSSYVSVVKNNFTFRLYASAANYTRANDPSTSPVCGDIVRGPATFFINTPAQAHGFTVKITPVSFSANQTLIVPPGTNHVQISLESSTNLVNWASATNGVYGSPDEARFFRIHLQKLD